MEVQVSGVLGGFKKRWWLFPVAIVLLWLAGGIYMLIAEPQYRAQVNLFYVDDQTRQGQSPAGGVASTLAATVGIAAPASSERQIALAILNSNSLMANFIKANNLLPVLYADRWDAKAGAWAVRGTDIPTLDMGVNRLKSLRTIADNSDTGVISVTLTLSRKELVAPLVNRFVAMADKTLRDRALSRAQSSYRYLQTQLTDMTITDLRASTIMIATQQLQRMMMANNAGAYALEVLDPGVTPREPIWPRPMLLLAVLAVLGVVGAAAVCVIVDLRDAV